MEEEGIGIVLARAVELRMKISNCIHKATTSDSSFSKDNPQGEGEGEGEELGLNVGSIKKPDPNSQSHDGDVGEADENEEEDDETERLLNIRDALESLENQLASLQAMQQQQRYEREVALAEIDYSRKMLLGKLKDYKGEDLEVIQEASAFAGETVEHSNDLLLPPYPSRPPHSLIVDNGYLSHLPSMHKSLRNGVISGDPIKETKKLNRSESKHKETNSRNSNKGLGHVIGAAAKTVITLLGVISILSLSGLGPSFGKRITPFKISGLFLQPGTKGKKTTLQCPPGKVLVVEDGEARCIVKERVAVPFELVATKPDVNYGCG